MSARGKLARLRVEGTEALHRPRLAFHILEEYGREPWKALKRRQVRDALKAVAAVRRGCAFFPSSHEKNGPKYVDAAQAALEALEYLTSRKVWGR